ncbi:hypothetical protein [Pseudarthrobacter sulfonivorans]|uniref:hypothetical protein n=1 Tax=Pseudarthrobacter sulfonivorans TaxID=121292 RepID=UPI00168B0DB9|nr:hypothetical protein [Pseudarthrobacter sulfonivorans]
MRVSAAAIRPAAEVDVAAAEGASEGAGVPLPMRRFGAGGAAAAVGCAAVSAVALLSAATGESTVAGELDGVAAAGPGVGGQGSLAGTPGGVSSGL